jgi:hypothetical protein
VSDYQRALDEHATRLTVGARVRISLGECPYLASRGARINGRVGHYDEANGLAGVIVNDHDETTTVKKVTFDRFGWSVLRSDPAITAEHRYVVKYDTPPRIAGDERLRPSHGSFCAAELTSIDEP